jgi:hypothetical protein
MTEDDWYFIELKLEFERLQKKYFKMRRTLIILIHKVIKKTE